MSFLKDFQEFAIKGNVMDMAVGVIIGGAFGKIVNSLVNDVIMPPVGRLIGNLDFSGLFINLSSTPVSSIKEAAEKKIPVLAYGSFITNVIDFTILAFVIFVMVKQINRFKKPAPVPEPDRLCPYCKSPVAKDATRCPHCTSEIPLEGTEVA